MDAEESVVALGETVSLVCVCFGIEPGCFLGAGWSILCVGSCEKANSLSGDKRATWRSPLQRTVTPAVLHEGSLRAQSHALTFQIITGSGKTFPHLDAELYVGPGQPVQCQDLATAGNG